MKINICDFCIKEKPDMVGVNAAKLTRKVKSPTTVYSLSGCEKHDADLKAPEKPEDFIKLVESFF